MSEFKPGIINIAEICARKEVCHFVLSPGSRSAPLSLAFLRHPKIQCRILVDERAAAFVALGMAQQLRQPVGLVCTSGTAALNYAPAVAEAYYQQIPLLIFTADRPPEWIDQNDGQTIHQRDLYAPHCRASYELPVDDTHPDARWHVARIISEAINTTQWPVPGPVHINVPLREPLYPEKDLHYKSEFRAVQLTPPQTNLTNQQWDELLKIWHKSPRRLIVAGMYHPDKDILSYLQKLSKDSNTAIIFDITSNMHGGLHLHHSDMILGTRNLEKLKALQPNLLITFGGPVVSKNLKLYLRKFKPRLHWQLQSHSRCIDTFQSLTHILPVSPEYFFAGLVERTHRVTSSTSEKSNSYQKFWSECEERASRALGNFLEKAPHSEFTAMNLILKSLPPKCNLHLGNSFVVRVANFIGLQGTQRVRVNSNRGTNGIDGTVSTAVGASLVNEELTCLITGDLAFFYDRNGLWQHDLPANLRIIILNNQGGGIFRILDGAKELPELKQFFEVEHHLTAENTARDFGLDYFCCEDSKSLKTCLKKFFQPSKRPAILEIKTNKYVNAETFENFKKIMWEEL